MRWAIAMLVIVPLTFAAGFVGGAIARDRRVGGQFDREWCAALLGARQVPPPHDLLAPVSP